MMLATDAENAVETKPEPAGIRGWLLLPAIGIPFGALKIISEWGKAVSGTAASDALILHTYFGGLLVWMLFIGHRFFTKSHLARKAVIVFLIATAVLAAALDAGNYWLTSTYPPAEMLTTIRIALWNGVWAIYFWRSRRVRNTFVNS